MMFELQISVATEVASREEAQKMADAIAEHLADYWDNVACIKSECYIRGWVLPEVMNWKEATSD
jgi:siroheme synthase (precorrin-2 oxidase/ferrochelatase)